MHTHEKLTRDQSKEVISTKPPEKQERIIKLIQNQRIDNPCLDLCNQSLSCIPMELFILPHLTQLYLEGNFLTELPENFFDRLPALEWLDLRNNKLVTLPKSIGRHQCLKTLLLEGNALTHLPFDMGMIKCLNGLNLRGNPLVIPPQHIIDQGVHVILSYLYQELQNRTKNLTDNVEKLNLFDDGASTSEEEILTEAVNLTGGRNVPSPMSDDYELVRHGPKPTPVPFHTPLMNQSNKGRTHSNGLFEGFETLLRGGKKDVSFLQSKQQEEARKEQLRLMKERQSAHADQRRKDAAVLEEWKSVTRKQQRDAIRSKPELVFNLPPYGIDLSLQNGVEQSRIKVFQGVHEERVERVMPNFGSQRRKLRFVSSSAQTNLEAASSLCLNKQTHMFVEIPNQIYEDKVNRLLSKKESVKKDKVIPTKKPWLLVETSPKSVIKKNVAVQKRIRQHSSKVLNQLKKLRDDRDAAAGERALNQTNELSKSGQLEYRFRAFTGDSTSVHSGSNKSSI